MGSEQVVPWGLVLSTLTVRFVAVFIVLSILGIGISIAAKIMAKLPGGDG
jgi:hypothetical protein